jgi:hypothetical protein
MKPKGNCEKISRALAEHAGRPLIGAMAEPLREHLDRCPDCRRIHEENTGLLLTLRQEPRNDPGPEFWNRMTSGIMTEVRHLETRPQPWYRRPWLNPWSWPVYAWSPALALLVLSAGFYYYGALSKPVFMARNEVPAADSRLEVLGDPLADPFMTLTAEESTRLRKKMGLRLAGDLLARNDEGEEAVLDWDLSNRLEALTTRDLNTVADKLQTGTPAGTKEVTGNVS